MDQKKDTGTDNSPTLLTVDDPGMGLNAWAEHVNAWAESKGWNETSVNEPGFIGDQLMLVVTELAEAKEDDRRGKMETYLEEGTGKPCGFPTEIADTLIRLFNLSARLGIDLEAEVGKKMGYNHTRARRHGGLRS